MKAELIKELVTVEVIGSSSPYATRAHIVDLCNQLASAEERAAKAEQEPVCADPSAPLASCVYCNGVVHTCEKAEGPDYRCPAHPNEREDDGEWFCSETCWYEDALARLIAQRDDLAATVAGLRGALEEAVTELEDDSSELCGEKCEACQKTALWRAALAASPAEHAARLKAAAIAEYIDNNGTTCDCCQHVMIDVTAAAKDEQGHCTAGDPEGEGSGCAWGWHEDADRRELRAQAEALRSVAKAIEADRSHTADSADGAARPCDVKDSIVGSILAEADRLEKAVVA